MLKRICCVNGFNFVNFDTKSFRSILVPPTTCCTLNHLILVSSRRSRAIQSARAASNNLQHWDWGTLEHWTRIEEQCCKLVYIITIWDVTCSMTAIGMDNWADAHGERSIFVYIFGVQCVQLYALRLFGPIVHWTNVFVIYAQRSLEVCEEWPLHNMLANYRQRWTFSVCLTPVA